MAQHLISCGACGGLVPARAAACLHCAAPIAANAIWSRLFHLLAGGGFMMTLAACYGVAYRPGPNYAGQTDNDHDGSYTPADCDDALADRYPGAADPDGDGVDQNCDGVDGWRDPAVMATPGAATPVEPEPAPAKPAHIAVPPTP